MDKYDHDEPEPVPHYFDTKSSPTHNTPLGDKGSVPQNVAIMIPIRWSEPLLDTTYPLLSQLNQRTHMVVICRLPDLILATY